jgi:hypothetical protein
MSATRRSPVRRFPRERGRLFRDDAGLIRWAEAIRPELLEPCEW